VDLPLSNIDGLGESTVTFLSCHFWFIVFQRGLVNEKGGTFTDLDKIVAGFSITRVSTLSVAPDGD